MVELYFPINGYSSMQTSLVDGQIGYGYF